jgi:hypothetical protein
LGGTLRRIEPSLHSFVEEISKTFAGCLRPLDRYERGCRSPMLEGDELLFAPTLPYRGLSAASLTSQISFQA